MPMFDTIEQVTEELVNCQMAAYQAVHIVADEQWTMALKVVQDAAEKSSAKEKFSVAIWDMNSGLYVRDGAQTSKPMDGTKNIVTAMGAMTQPDTAIPMRCFGVFEHPDYILAQSPGAIAALRQIISDRLVVRNNLIGGKALRRMLVMITVGDTMPTDLKPYLPTIYLPKPSDERLTYLVNTAVNGSGLKKVDEKVKQIAAHALRGLGDQSAQNVISKSLVAVKDMRDTTIDLIERSKANIVSSSNALEYVPRDTIRKMTDLAGYDALKEWVSLRRHSIYETNEQIDPVKGIMIVGVPGTGKSVCGRLVARWLDMPFFRLDIGSLYGSLVGETERNFRNAVATITAQRGCVVLIDEIDKAMGGAHEATGDSGVTQRSLGTILTWMTEKTDPSFVIMTANRVSGLPPELLRRGRLDEIFYVDMPTDEQRKEIFSIHMRRRKVDPTLYSDAQWRKLMEFSVDFVGAELESAVAEATLQAYHAESLKGPVTKPVHPTVDQIVKELQRVPSMKTRSRDNIDAISKWGKNNARSVASSPTDGLELSQAGASFALDLGIDIG